MSCPFFDNLPANPNINQINEALLSAVVTAQQNAMPAFKRRIKEKFIRFNQNPSDDDIKLCYIFHTSDIAYAVEDLFVGDSRVKERIGQVFDNPEIANLDSEMLENGFYHMGFIYAMYWYAITETVADPSVCVALNHAHAEAIQTALEELSYELEGKHLPRKKTTTYSPRKKSSSWPYWIAMLVLGIIIGFAFQSCDGEEKQTDTTTQPVSDTTNAASGRTQIYYKTDYAGNTITTVVELPEDDWTGDLEGENPQKGDTFGNHTLAW